MANPNPIPDRFIDKVDFTAPGGCWLWGAAKNKKGYGVFGVGTRGSGDKGTVLAHRFIYQATVSHLGILEHLDHICHTPACINPDHLRPCSIAENSRNQRRLQSNTSGFKGVSFSKKERRWIARIKLNRVTIRIGAFLDPSEAHDAYCAAAVKYHGEFANFGK